MPLRLSDQGVGHHETRVIQLLEAIAKKLGIGDTVAEAKDPDLVKESHVGPDDSKLGEGERFMTAAENRAADKAEANAKS